LHDEDDVVIPYNTNGKARCGRLKLLEKLDDINLMRDKNGK
jgi:hypothetical protein